MILELGSAAHADDDQLLVQHRAQPPAQPHVRQI